MKSKSNLAYLQDVEVSNVGKLLDGTNVFIHSYLLSTNLFNNYPLILSLSAPVGPNSVNALEVQNITTYSVESSVVYLYCILSDTSAESNLVKLDSSIITQVSDPFGEALWQIIP